MMAGIRSKNTKPELLMRKALHRLGFRYRLHDHKLPGKPDLVFPKYGSVLFVNGCFWHGHDCHLFKMPKTRTDFWRNKIETNRRRDATVRAQLDRLGIRHRTIWECDLKNRDIDHIDRIVHDCANWIEQGRNPQR